MPGLRASRATAFSTGASGPVQASGPVVPSAPTPPGHGHRRGQLGDPGAQLGDLGVQDGDLVQRQSGELAAVVIGAVPGQARRYRTGMAARWLAFRLASM